MFQKKFNKILQFEEENAEKITVFSFNLTQRLNVFSIIVQISEFAAAHTICYIGANAHKNGEF